MIYKEIRVDGFLKNFIKSFWSYETKKDITHTILPDGYFNLIIVFESEVLKNIMLTGIWTRPQNIKINKNTTFFSIHCKLLAAKYIFKREIKSILNTSKDLDLDFWNIDTVKSDEFEKFTNHSMVYIKNSLKDLNIKDKELKLFDLIYEDKLNNVNEISKNISYSSRQINRYFNNNFGLSLKEFLKIIRFNSSFNNLSKGILFPQSEYFDQSHFIKEVKKYSGLTPKEVHKNKNDRFLQLFTRKK